jgi:hypothetical protein
MSVQTSRYYGSRLIGTKATQLSLTTAVGTSTDIPFGEFNGGCIYIPAGSTITSLTFYAAPRQASDPDPSVPAQQGNAPAALTYYQLANPSFPAGITLAVAAGFAYDLPSDVAGIASLRIVGNNAGAVELTLKS